MNEKIGSPKTPGINDLVFRQFQLRGFTETGGARIWDVADSKLWYLTPEQAMGFLAIERSKEYSAAVTDKEIALLKAHVGSIAREMNSSPTNLIDLGCGDGAKAVLFIGDFMQSMPVRYCPIDISSYMVQEASHAVEKTGLAPVERIFWNISDFENLDNVTPLFRNEQFPHHCFLFLGNTLGNFDQKDILHGIRRGMQPGDVLVIGNGISQGGDTQEWIQSYSGGEIDDFCVRVLLQAGHTRENLTFDVQNVGNRIEMRYVVNQDVTIHNLGKSLVFQAGDIIRVVISYKYSEEQLSRMLQEFFPDVTIHTDSEKTYALAICKP